LWVLRVKDERVFTQKERLVLGKNKVYLA